jgi:hypothetical protein
MQAINQVTKKRPGRPKRVLAPTLKDGVVDIPFDESSQVELEYNRPELLKRSFTLLKAANCDLLKLTFNETSVNISSIDHYDKTTIDIDIDCINIDRYYNRQPITLYVYTKCLEKVLRVIDKSYISMKWIIKQLDTRLYISYTTQLGVNELYMLNTLPEPDDIVERPIVQQHEISFTVPSKHLKKIVSDASTFTSILTFELTDGNLSYSFVSDDSTTIATNRFQNPKSIDLRCEIDVYRSSIAIEYIKSIASTIICEAITIRSGTNQPFILHSVVDLGVLTVTTSTKSIGQ